MKKVIVGSLLLCSALAVSPAMAGDFHALGALSPSLAPMTDTQLESVKGGLFNYNSGNIAVIVQVNKCKKAKCSNDADVHQRVVYKNWR